MSDLLVDARVAIKWFVEEEFSERATALAEIAIAEHSRRICPPHLMSEVLNAIYRRTQRGDAFRLDMDEAIEAVDLFLATDWIPIFSDELYRHAWILARRYQISTIYDALYVALADLYKTPLWTADRPLYEAVNDTRLVRWIGDYEG